MRRKRLVVELANRRLVIMANIGMCFLPDDLTGSAYGNWALYTASPLRSFESELGVQPPAAFWDPVGFTRDEDEAALERIQLRWSLVASMSCRSSAPWVSRAFLVDSYVTGGTAITVARRNFPRQYLHYHRAGPGAIASPQTQRGFTAFVHTKIPVRSSRIWVCSQSLSARRATPSGRENPQGNQVFCQMNECFPEAAKATRACVKKTGASEFSY
jgi:hypothetical protein